MLSYQYRDSHYDNKTTFRVISPQWCLLTGNTTSSYQIKAHYHDVILSSMTSKITSLTIVYSTIYSRAYQRKHQSSASLAFVCGFHRWPVNSPHKGPVTRKNFPFDDVIISIKISLTCSIHFMVSVKGGIFLYYWLRRHVTDNATNLLTNIVLIKT